MKALTPLLLLLPLLSACDMIYEALEIPNPQKEAAQHETEARAIGGACRQSGRSLEDCYLLNPDYAKAAIFAGWREMNDYMIQNQLETVPSQLTPPGPYGSTPGGAPLVSPPVTSTPGAI
jgi:hypothetical protein